MGLSVTFQVNLETDNLYNSKQPYNTSQLENFRGTRTAYFPNIFGNNRELKDGATFTVNDSHALYLIQNYTNYQVPPTSGTAAPPPRLAPTGTVVDINATGGITSQTLLTVLSYTLT